MPRILAAFLAVLAVSLPAVSQLTPSMTAHFIDVGQAHATLLEFPCGAMLIDVGTQDDAHETTLVNYLESFFARRADLGRTLESILITHNHLDHTRSLRRVVETFNVERYIDNGFTTGSGRAGPNWLREEVAAGRRSTMVRDIPDAAVEAVTDKHGLTDADIDPLACPDRDPQVRILQGRFDDNPGWPEGEFENQNNHSVVTRIDFGTASFLFMGDLEEDGIELLTEYYGHAAGGMLDADVLQVGHHGSHNATTAELLQAVTPRVAVIPVGEWTFGRDGGRFTTFAFGHPRKPVVDLLAQHITRQRTPAKSVRVANKAKEFRSQTVAKAIYATGWDGTVRVVAKAANDITVFREH
jgi:beta-lactamase superfamily II metal-dependent hydrolase